APAAGSAPAGEPSYGTAVPPLGEARLEPTVKGKTVLAVGDSWAANIGAGMSKVASAENTVVNAGLGGCGLMLSTAPDAPADCREWPQKWPGYLARYRPDAVLLMVAYWDLTPQRLTAGGPQRDLRDPAHRKVFTTNLNRAIGLLTAGGAKVYLMNSKLVDQPALRPAALIMNRLLREAADAHAAEGVRLLDVRGQLCNDKGCPPVIAGTNVYDPTGHPADAARDRLATWVLNTMFPAREGST
ncbi:DUF459 domain-containing protein, partial [Actinocorallia lasiicapitis]